MFFCYALCLSIWLYVRAYVHRTYIRANVWEARSTRVDIYIQFVSTPIVYAGLMAFMFRSYIETAMKLSLLFT